MYFFAYQRNPLNSLCKPWDICGPWYVGKCYKIIMAVKYYDSGNSDYIRNSFASVLFYGQKCSKNLVPK